MQLRPAFVAGLVVAQLAACGATTVVPHADGPTVVFHGGRIYVDARSAPVEALFVRGGQVVFTGPDADILRMATDETERIDLEGAVVVPGLQDAHGHLASLGATLESVDLVGCASYDELIERVAARAAELPPGSWVTGRGWDQSLWPGGAFPHHRALSERVPDHPVLLERVDGHAALANERALALAGLVPRPEAWPELVGGRVHVDASGEATGVLVDTAAGLVEALLPAVDRATLRRRLLRAQHELVACGLTAVHDMGLDLDTVAVLRQLEREGALRLRVIGYLWANDGLDEQTRAHFPSPADRNEGARVRVLGGKLMLDGAMGSRGAALLEDYADEAGTRGHLLLEPERFATLVEELVAAGLQPATHAIGDRANRLVLDTYDELLRREPAFAALRPRVEHAQLVAQADWPRFAALEVIPSMQPTHATSDMRWVADRVGPERARGAYAWRRLGSHRAPLAFGSDFPVERPQPLEGLYAARTRCDRSGQPLGGWQPDQILSGRAALAAFTEGAAFAAREARRGNLQPGSYADMTILDVDPVLCEPAELLTAHVLGTVLEGKLVQRAAPPGAAR